MRSVDILAASRPLVLERQGRSSVSTFESAAIHTLKRDTARISDAGQGMLAAETKRLERQRQQVRGEAEAPVDDGLRAEVAQTEHDERVAETDPDDKNANGKKEQRDNPNELSPEEIEVVRKLQSRDREVRSHEQAHQSVGGQYAGNASFTYQRGPDNRRYAIGGEVPIDVGKESEPEQTIDKMRIVRRAALAPAEPSAADRRVASVASSNESQAQQELFANRMEAQREEQEKKAEASGDEQQGRLNDKSENMNAASPSERQVAQVRGETINAVA